MRILKRFGLVAVWALALAGIGTPAMARFLSVDPVPVDKTEGSNFNRYWYANNNPYKYVDPDGRWAETAWDATSLAIGATSLVGNVQQGNWGSAAIDAGGILVDAVLTAIPVVPAGAGVAIGASRAADKVADATRVEVKERAAAGADGGQSRITIERNAQSGEALSRTHTVEKEGQVVHQHQEHMGKHGSERSFPDEWTGTETINAEPKMK